MQAQKRTPGRPTSQDAGKAQEKIVLAASRNFAQHGIKGSSNQMIAGDAGVTPAMVHYYFKNKHDLHRAILAHAFEPIIEKLQKTESLNDWVMLFHRHLCTRPWLPHLMIREVLPHNGTLRPIFLADFGPRIYVTLRTMVNAEGERLNAGTGFDVERHVVLLMGMLIYPFLGMEIAENITGRKFDQNMLEGFRDDALALFSKGIAGQ